MSKRIFAFAAAVCLAASPAAFSSAARAQPSSSPISGRLGYLCAGMGLEPGEAGFVYCVMSLKDTVALAVESGTPIRLPRYRHHRGPKGSYVSHMPLAAWRRSGHSVGIWSFSRSPSYEQRGREVDACAGLGLPVGSYIFWQCVGDLDMTLFRVNLVGAD